MIVNLEIHFLVPPKNKKHKLQINNPKINNTNSKKMIKMSVRPNLKKDYSVVVAKQTMIE